MASDRLYRCAGTAAALCLAACAPSLSTSGEAVTVGEGSTSATRVSADGIIAGSSTAAVDGLPSSQPAYPAPEPLTRAASERIWGNLFGRYQRAARQRLTPEEQAFVRARLEGQVAAEDVSFVGSNVIVQDVVFGGEPLFRALRSIESSGSVDKGKVLAQVVTQVIGVHDTTLVQPSDVVGAPSLYASQPIDSQFLFDRPEVDSGFEHLLVLADDVPAEIVAAFRASVAEIGNASGADCLGPEFLQVILRSEFDARFADGVGIPPRVTEVFYSPEACGGRSLGCTQFPHAEDVVVSLPTAEGEAGSFQSRIVFGSFIGINAAAITPESEEFSTLTHELLHALGLAHPVVETFANGAVAAKLVVPGTLSADSAFPSIMAFRSTADRTFNLSADDVDTIRTLYASAQGCAYQSAPLVIEATDDPSVPGDAGTDAQPSDSQAAPDAQIPDAGSDGGADGGR